MENNIEKRERAPFEQLVKIAEQKLRELFPDLVKGAGEKALPRTAEIFVGDILAKNDLPSIAFHRFTPERQKEILGNQNLEDLFKGVAEDESLINFYREKLNGSKPPFSIDDMTDEPDK